MRLIICVENMEGHVIRMGIRAVWFIFLLDFTAGECLDRMGKHVATEPPSSPIEPPNFRIRLRKIFLSIGLGVITGLFCALLFALLVRNFVKCINRGAPIVKGQLLFAPKISPKILRAALSNNPQLLGGGATGRSYRAVLDNGLVVAVKRLEPLSVEDKGLRKKVQQELEALATLRHGNLMSLRTYVCDGNGCCLVYDYAPMGSLEDAMKRVRENRLELKWEFRLKIAVGIVRGLHYLHFTCEPRRLHCNLKPSNVIVDSEYKPRLADCALAAIIPNFRRAASGYNAPECFQNCRYTDKSDVFSFGVILGVLLTGRDPMDPFFGELSTGGSLGQWLRHLQQAGDAREALDKSILGEQTEEDEMLIAVRIAVVCLSDLPADRPSSDELVSMLTQLNSF